MRFDPDVSQTLRLEFARSNTKVSKPVNKQAVLTSAPAFYPREPQLSKYLEYLECYVFKVERLLIYLFPINYSLMLLSIQIADFPLFTFHVLVLKPRPRLLISRLL